MTSLRKFRIPGDDEIIIGQDPLEITSGLRPIEMWHPNVIAVDQSLTASGWAWLRNGVVEETGMVGTDPTEYKGFEDSFRRGVMLYEGFRAVLLPRLLESGPLLLAHETPSVPTAKTRRTDVGLISCMALRCAAASLGMPTPLMLQAQKIRTTLCGTSAATKKDIREVVKKTVQLNQGLRYLNNNTYDAMAIAIIAAERNGNG